MTGLEFSINQEVKLSGLVNHEDLNGQKGTVEQYDAMKARYVIKLEETKKKILVKPGNLESINLSWLNASDEGSSDGEDFGAGVPLKTQAEVRRFDRQEKLINDAIGV